MRKKTAKKKSARWYWILGSLIVSLLLYITFVLWQQYRNSEAARFAMYAGFGIELPLGYAIHGIDVSYYQQMIYWPSVQKMNEDDVNIHFAFIKATEGISKSDKLFKRNWEKTKESGITRGAYHFFIATKDGRAQAKNFIRHVKLLPGDLPPVLDVEEHYGVSAAVLQMRIRDFLQTVEDAYKVKPIIYSNASFYNNYLGESFNEYPLWVAHYFEKKQPGVVRDWQFWQHNSSGKVNGIASRVDFNVFNGDYDDFMQLLLK